MKQLKRESDFNLPIKILQFGEGNFLRGFVDWMVERMNHTTGFNAGVTIVKPRVSANCDTYETINAQDGLYHVIVRGIENGQTVDTIERISCVKQCLNPATDWDVILETALEPELRYVFSNTTEAGIEYRAGMDTFPAKLARVVTARAKAQLGGLVFLPCELIEDNGTNLKACLLRYITDAEVVDYVNQKCIFCNTLVDRIVSGYPREEAVTYCEKLGLEDKLLVCAEPFHFMAIEGPKELAEELPFQQAELNVIFTDNLEPYRTRKVRFLNGAHTASVLEAHLRGLTFVDEMIRDPYFNQLLKTVLFEEVDATLDLDPTEKRQYAESIFERFANPYAHHRLLSIALNSVSKWSVRILPTLLDYQRKMGKLPECLTTSLASLINFYRTCEIQDSDEIKAFFETQPNLRTILVRTDFWGMDLNAIDGLYDFLTEKGIQ